MVQLQVRRLGYALGAEVRGVDISRPLDDATIAAVRRAVLDHIVVCLPGQKTGAEQLREFAGRFGEYDVVNTRALPQHPEIPEVVLRANKTHAVGGKQSGRVPPGDRWHTDYSHSLHPATLSFLLAKELPGVGGDTLFANLYAAYETLSPAYRRAIASLEAVHDYARGGGYAARTPDAQAKLKAQQPPVIHPLVRAHDETGRDALYIADRIRNFVGMTEEETQPITRYLMDHATRYENVYRHRWTVNDLIIWDNRCALHLAVQDYDQSLLRLMLRCSLIGGRSGKAYEAAELAAASP